MSTKVAPRLRARAIWKSKSLKHRGFGRLLEVDLDKICTTPARESDLAVKIVKNWQARSTFGSWHRQNLHHACARERFGSQNRSNVAWSEHFWKLTSTKFAPRLRARTIRTSKSLKTDGLGTFFEVQSVFRVAGAGISTRCKIRGRRRSSWGLQKRWQAWGIWRGSETMRFAWQAQWFGALWCRCLKPPTLKPWKGCKLHVTEVLLCNDHFAWQLHDFVCLGSTVSWQAQYFWSIHLKIVKTYWNSEDKCLLNMSILKEVSQKCFVFGLQRFIFEGSLAKKLRFWALTLQFWRKSRKKASFLIFKASFLKEVSQKCFVLSFKASILKEVSQKSFVFDLQSFIFEGSLAELLRFWASKLQFWRKSRRKASFLIFKASFLKEVSQKSFVWQNYLNHTSVDNQITWTSNHLTSKSLESQIYWQPTHLNLKPIGNQITWISDQLTTESLESQINWQPHHLKFKSTDNQNHLKRTSIDNQIIWISNQLTTKSIESQINWQPKSFESQIRWQPNHLTLNSFESDISWLSNQLNSAQSLPIGSLSLETSAAALCGRYVKYIISIVISIIAIIIILWFLLVLSIVIYCDYVIYS